MAHRICFSSLSNSDVKITDFSRPSPVVDKVANRQQFLELQKESQKGEDPVAAEDEEVAEDQKSGEGERLERMGVESLK